MKEKIIHGVFNGENMVDKLGRSYPINSNYISKSKLVVGDGLKLTIKEDGNFIFKQIAPVIRQKQIAVAKETPFGICACKGDNLYRLITSSVTYFKIKPGDTIIILLPKFGHSEWAAIENKLEEEDKDLLEN